MRGDALRSALAQVLKAVPLEPPLEELSVLDIVNVDVKSGKIKRNGDRLEIATEIQYTETGFCDKHLVERGYWSEQVAADIRARLRRSGAPVDLSVTDEEVESINENNNHLGKRLKPRTGVVVRVVMGSLDALCEKCDDDEEGADYLTDDDSRSLLEIPICKYGIIGAEVLCMDDNGQLYRLSEKLFQAK